MNSRILGYTGFIVSLIGLQTSLAQSLVEGKSRYQAAVRLVQSKAYEKAKTELNTIIQREGPYAPFAHYYYALASFRQKNYAQARLMLKQLIARYPDWVQLDDAQYLLAASAMEMGQYEDALTALGRIGDAIMRPAMTQLEQTFIPRITDLRRLKNLNREFPENRTVGLALVELIQRTGSDKADLELSDRLTNRFGGAANAAAQSSTSSPETAAPNAAATSTVQRTGRPKNGYTVAVLFPFRLDEFDINKRRANQYVYDLYNGMKLANEKLQAEGVGVNLMAYDLDNDPNKTLELVSSPGFSRTDLMIGPLYVEPNRIATAFANQQNIWLLNPIATNSDLVAEQPMAFLVQPSLNEQARVAAEQAQSFSGAKRVAIYYGTSRKDSLLATAYRQELLAQRYQVVDFRKLTGSAQNMATTMKLTGTGPANAAPAGGYTSSVGPTLHHVFLASSNEADGPRLVEALSRRKANAPVVATSSAFDLYKNPGSTFSRRDVYLISPDFVDAARPSVAAFDDEYLAKRNTIPSIFARQGYDMLLFFGRQLAKNGPGPVNRNDMRSDADDYLLAGFDYTQSNDNQNVPIVKYQDGRFVRIN
ncbi:tetratricopeptide repeat protein [Spirosoma sp. KUDC1026]|uniref:tetratricopeptide repeat protein n=1 Tax=Spirosoma sp. KUDC1026 TaxID=2745947 RepID=UPI00159BAC19|nr:tetratricopeptide repeat protein [Spirosoma sp. KUDC1026]QKZ13941.1 ABC transporter substrate-binding protein [Spirosoma sp. KUDC1026]